MAGFPLVDVAPADTSAGARPLSLDEELALGTPQAPDRATSRQRAVPRSRPVPAPSPAPVGEPDRSPHDAPDDPDDQDPGLLGGRAARLQAWRELPSRLPKVNPPAANLVLLLLAVGLACWVATAFVPGPHAVIVAGAALSPLASIAAIPVIAFAARGRQWVTVVVGTVAATVPWILVAPYAAPAPELGRGTVPMRVMVLNTHVGEADPQQIATAVREHAVDLLVLTEVTDSLAHALTAAGIDAVVQPRWLSQVDDDYGRLGVWSRFPVDVIAPVEGTNAPVARGTVRTPAGDVELVAAQVVSPLPSGLPLLRDAGPWHRDLRAVTEAARSGAPRRLLVGDLNGTPWNADYRRLEKVTGLEDAGDAAGRGLRPTWPAWGPLPLVPLDHVLVGGRVGVTAIGTVIVTGTDHRAVVVDLALGRG